MKNSGDVYELNEVVRPQLLPSREPPGLTAPAVRILIHQVLV